MVGGGGDLFRFLGMLDAWSGGVEYVKWRHDGI